MLLQIKHLSKIQNKPEWSCISFNIFISSSKVVCARPTKPPTLIFSSTEPIFFMTKSKIQKLNPFINISSSFFFYSNHPKLGLTHVKESKVIEHQPMEVSKEEPSRFQPQRTTPAEKVGSSWKNNLQGGAFTQPKINTHQLASKHANQSMNSLSLFLFLSPQRNRPFNEIHSSVITITIKLTWFFLQPKASPSLSLSPRLQRVAIYLLETGKSVHALILRTHFQ